MDLTPQLRSAMTLGVLALLFVIGVAWAWSSVTEPFPERVETPPCTDKAVAAGDVVRPGQVLVNVLNASNSDGLAGETLKALVRRGFAEGTRGNGGTNPKARGALVLAADPDDPAARLVRSYLGKKARILDQPGAAPGITVVVGDRFPGVKKGRRGVKAEEDTTVCTPTDLDRPL